MNGWKNLSRASAPLARMPAVMRESQAIAANPAQGCCSAAIAPQATGRDRDKYNENKALTGYDAILTWFGVLSMVRAALEGDGASFPSTRLGFGSPQHG
jgi:hypothetical protein